MHLCVLFFTSDCTKQCQWYRQQQREDFGSLSSSIPVIYQQGSLLHLGAVLMPTQGTSNFLLNSIFLYGEEPHQAKYARWAEAKLLLIPLLLSLKKSSVIFPAWTQTDLSSILQLITFNSILLWWMKICRSQPQSSRFWDRNINK